MLNRPGLTRKLGQTFLKIDDTTRMVASTEMTGVTGGVAAAAITSRRGVVATNDLPGTTGTGIIGALILATAALSGTRSTLKIQPITTIIPTGVTGLTATAGGETITRTPAAGESIIRTPAAGEIITRTSVPAYRP